MTFQDFRRKISHIVGQAIGPGQFKAVINERDRSGAFRAKEQKDVIIEILAYLEDRDDEKPVSEQPTA